MPTDAATKSQLSQFGRTIALLFNRSMMYQAGHPLVEQSIDQFLEGARGLLKILSPLVFLEKGDGSGGPGDEGTGDSGTGPGEHGDLLFQQLEVIGKHRKKR